MNIDSDVEGSETENPSKKNKRLPRILDGKYFTISNEDKDKDWFKDNKIEATCTICHELKKGNILSTGNFLSHYKLKHSDKLVEVKEYTKETKFKNPPNQPTLQEAFTATPDEVSSRIFSQ